MTRALNTGKKKFGNELSKRTRSAQALGKIDDTTRAIVSPIHLATTFLRDPDNTYSSGFVYGRPDNQTVRDAEALIAMWEDADEALLFSSGMAAATALIMALKPGDHVVAPEVMYWSLRNWLKTFATKWGLQISFIDMTNLAEVKKSLSTNPQLLWLETPSNPLWSISDIKAISDLAHKKGARVAVDSTAATPVLTHPLMLGADYVMHAATKALNGHSDVVAGALATRQNDALWQNVKTNRKTFGAILGPFEAYLLTRGMRTVDLRVREASRSALDLAKRLITHADIVEVLYPGLPAFKGHSLAKRQMRGGFGHMLSIRVKGGEASAIATAAGVELWKRATSLGGVESLIEHRASIEGEGTPCPPDLLRLSVGIEDVNDLFADLDHALRRTKGNRNRT